MLRSLMVSVRKAPCVCGGGGGNRTRVPKIGPIAFYKFSQFFLFRGGGFAS